jgi:hypothetical protein
MILAVADPAPVAYRAIMARKPAHQIIEFGRKAERAVRTFVAYKYRQ